MATPDDSSSDLEPRRLIYATRRRVQAARNKYYQAALQDGVKGAHIADLAKAAIEYHDILREHRDEDILNPEWSERNLDWLRDYIGETVTVEKPAPGMTSNTTTEEVPAIYTLDPERIVELTEQLDDICKELGLSVDIKESNPRVEIDNDLLEEVDEWRIDHLE